MLECKCLSRLLQTSSGPFPSSPQENIWKMSEWVHVTIQQENVCGKRVGGSMTFNMWPMLYWKITRSSGWKEFGKRWRRCLLGLTKQILLDVSHGSIRVIKTNNNGIMQQTFCNVPFVINFKLSHVHQVTYTYFYFDHLCHHLPRANFSPYSYFSTRTDSFRNLSSLCMTSQMSGN